MQNYPIQVPHPVEIAESFRLGATTISPFNINHTTEGLIKLLMYGDYVRAKISLGNASVQSVVTEDLHHYPYRKKDSFKVRSDF